MSEISIPIKIKHGIQSSLPSSAPEGQIMVTDDTSKIFHGTGFGIKEVDYASKGDVNNIQNGDTKVYYVSVNTGADTNDGLTAGTAFKTMAKALSVLPALLGNITINVADGVYPEGINIKSKNLPVLVIKGNETTPANVTFTSMTLTGLSGYVSISGLSFTTVTINSNISACNYVRLYKCLYAKSSSLGAISLNFSTAVVDSCEFTTTRPIIQATNSKVHALNCTGTTSRLFTGSYSIFSYGGTVPTYTTLLLENSPNVGTSVLVNAIPAPPTTPSETTITTGFNAEWSGTIKYRVAQDGLKTIYIQVAKTSDIASATEPVIQLPDILKALTNTRVYAVGWTDTATRIGGSLVEVSISGSGILQVNSCGAITTNVRKIEDFVMSYY